MLWSTLMRNLEKYKGLFVEAFQYDGDVEKLDINQ